MALTESPSTTSSRPPAWQGWLAVAFAGFSTLSFALALLWGVGFLTGFLPGRSVDSPVRSPAIHACLVDLAWPARFGLQHTLMARRGFKRL